MEQILRNLGIEMGLNGTGIMGRMLRKEVTTSQLTDQQVQEVLAAWDTRHFVPPRHFDDYRKDGTCDVDIVRPIIKKEEVEDGTYSQKDYDRNYVEMIEKYLKTV